MKLKDYLKKYFDFDDFRTGQEEIINAILSGNDTMAVMPTGGGKSICYQLPALMLKGTAIVISPLIALMKDQTDVLRSKGLPAEFINSSLSNSESLSRIESAMKGEYKLLFIAPERLSTYKFANMLQSIDISFLAVDEAHCISEWGHDFRPSYLKIPDIFKSVGRKIPTAAFTATATTEVISDIKSNLELESPKIFIKGFDRPNLSWFAFEGKNKDKDIADLLKSHDGGSVLIYCGSRKRAENLYGFLSSGGIKADYYHAGLHLNRRKYIQEQFIKGKRKIIIATSAFGMGIDKSDVRKVIHYDYTPSIEAYYQEAGRAGRDGKPAECFLFFDPDQDRYLQEFFINSSFPDSSDVKVVYEGLYDAGYVALGQLPMNNLVVNETKFANQLNLPVRTLSSSLNFLERNDILTRPYGNKKAILEFTAERNRILEYHENLSGDKKLVFDALLRSVSAEAFQRPVEIDLKEILRKFGIPEKSFKVSIDSYSYANILNFYPAGISGGIILNHPRTDFERVPIDWDNIAKRKEFAFHKLKLVEDYASTEMCKRNYILNYFNDTERYDPCGKCSSCLGIHRYRNYSSK